MAVSSLARPKVGLITATGGTVFDIPVVSRGLVMRVHKFETSSNFVVSAGAGQVEVLLCAAGGAGGGVVSVSNIYRAGGDGGGGGVILTTANVDAVTGTYAVAIGNGGTGVSGGEGNDGGDTTAFGLTAVGGGGGARGQTTGARGRDGGNGGGGSWPGSGVAGQGFRGGLMVNNGSSSSDVGVGSQFMSDIDGRLTEYSGSGQAGANEHASVTMAGTSPFSTYGAPGLGRSLYAAGVLTGSDGTDGVAIIRYALRSL